MVELADRNERIIGCRRCPRLVEWRESVGLAKRKSYNEWKYWSNPVPDFGDPSAERLIVGLAPAAHGANRTGQMFTGDRSGEWLFRALHKAGVATLPNASRVEDGLALRGVLITACCHCAPPDNKPTPEELTTCNGYLRELLISKDWRAILCLGSIAWNTLLKTIGEPRKRFAHMSTHNAPGMTIIASYHPSQQNTFTGRLTEPMLDEAISTFLSA